MAFEVLPGTEKVLRALEAAEGVYCEYTLKRHPGEVVVLCDSNPVASLWLEQGVPAGIGLRLRVQGNLKLDLAERALLGTQLQAWRVAAKFA